MRYDIIIDPSRDGCILWNKEFVTSIKGDINEVCKDIYSRVTYVLHNDEDEYKCFQFRKIGVDVTGIGRAYKDVLTKYGLEVGDIVGKPIDTFLEVNNKRLLPINQNIKL
jgi:adenylosuccinate synthase